uniref:Broad-complex core protein isoform 6 n=2 Tax=Lepeophtheirus salmonis TaxID=72036 RepID=C1BS33_LEPSM|nr:Broad-complex core protein isoform 6 [Lepeophtheirus salmonis]
MGSVERLCLLWNGYESNFKKGFFNLRQNEELFDVTLISGSKMIKAHKVILSACSPVFRSIIGSAPFQTHPLIYLRGINFNHLELLISFMYYGEVSVIQEELEDFISVAEEFQFEGLSNDPLSEKRCESQTSSFSTASSNPYTPHDSRDLSVVNDDINDFLSKSVPNTKNEDCYILDMSNDSEFTQNEPELMVTNNEAIDISSNRSKEFIEALNREIRQHYCKPIMGKGFQCKKCNFITKHQPSIRHHIEARHIVTKGFICSICDTTFKTRKTLRTHNYKSHKRGSTVFERLKVIQ